MWFMKVDNVSFTSKINFVDAKTFYYKFRQGLYVDPRDVDEFVCKSNEIFTDEVRTCTAGGVIDFNNSVVGAFHFFDDFDNNLALGRFLKELFGKIQNPQRALIVGGKQLRNSIYSIPNFTEICKGIKERVPKVTVFGEHKFPWSETDIHYSLKDDTWTIHSMYRPYNDYKEHEVLSLEDLHEAYKSVELAEGDSLYINGEQVIF